MRYCVGRKVDRMNVEGVQINSGRIRLFGPFVARQGHGHLVEPSITDVRGRGQPYREHDP